MSRIKLIIKIFCLALLAIHFSCTNTKPRKFEQLSETEIYEIINQGYVDYLDSMHHEKNTLDTFFELQDSSQVINVLNFLASQNSSPISNSYSNNIEHTINYSEKINTELVKNLNFVSKEQVNARIQNLWNSDTTLNHFQVYSISKPFRCETSSYVILQEFHETSFMNCIKDYARWIFFRKVADQWKVVLVM